MKIRLLVVLLLGIVLAQSTNSRIIKVEAPDGKVSGNIRTGPLTFESSKAGGVVGKVKDLVINSSKAILSAPEGKSIQDEGERIAAFDGSITVKRDRMTSSGPKLTYSEKTGLGVLEGSAKMHQEPKNKGDDAVDVSAPKMTFQVDTNISTSEGGVTLKNGNQEGKSDTVYYEEDRALAIFNDAKEVVLVRKRSDGELTIRAKEVRSLTDEKRLIATGGVSLFDGDITTTGDKLYYNDKTGDAYVFGNVATKVPAKSVRKDGSSISSGVILHNVNRKQARQYQQQTKFPEADFKKQAN